MKDGGNTYPEFRTAVDGGEFNTLSMETLRKAEALIEAGPKTPCGIVVSLRIENALKSRPVPELPYVQTLMLGVPIYVDPDQEDHAEAFYEEKLLRQRLEEIDERMKRKL